MMETTTQTTAFQPVALEDWLRDYYFTTEADLSSSGVEDYSMAEIREITGLTTEEIDNVVFRDSRSLGGHELRQAIAQRWADGDMERAMATHGSSEAIFLVMRSLLESGDEVVTLDPAYPQHVGMAKAIGCSVRYWQLDFERGFEPDMEELKALITPETRMVVVNFPHNPTGATLSLEQQKELVAAVERVGAYLVWDAAFAEITHDGNPELPDPGSWYERTITLGTLSKCYGLPGLRLGWCLAQPEILERLIVTRDYVTLHLSPLVELVAQRAIACGDGLVAARRRQAQGNLEVLAEWMSGHQDYVAWSRPRGGMSTFVRFRGVEDVEAFCHKLMEFYGVLLVPGKCFGDPKLARLGFGCSEQTLVEGLSRLSEALRNW